MSSRRRRRPRDPPRSRLSLLGGLDDRPELDRSGAGVALGPAVGRSRRRAECLDGRIQRRRGRSRWAGVGRRGGWRFDRALVGRGRVTDPLGLGRPRRLGRRAQRRVVGGTLRDGFGGFGGRGGSRLGRRRDRFPEGRWRQRDRRDRRVARRRGLRLRGGGRLGCGLGSDGGGVGVRCGRWWRLRRFGGTIPASSSPTTSVIAASGAAADSSRPSSGASSSAAGSAAACQPFGGAGDGGGCGASPRRPRPWHRRRPPAPRPRSARPCREPRARPAHCRRRPPPRKRSRPPRWSAGRRRGR